MKHKHSERKGYLFSKKGRRKGYLVECVDERTQESAACVVSCKKAHNCILNRVSS